jgi:hypothetical protein
MKFRLNNVQIKIPQALVDGAVSRALGDTLRESEQFKAIVAECMGDPVMVLNLLGDSPAFKAAVEGAVREETRRQAPGNPRIAKVITEVQEHLDRYPSIAHDVGLQAVVGKAIFDYMQKTL